MPNNPNNHIVIVAGEASGDLHASFLVKEIKKQKPDTTFSGLGGELMAQAGVELYEDLTKIAVIGFVEVLKHYSQFKKIFDRTLDEIRRRKPCAVVLVDYPGFNLRLAKKVKQLGIPVIFYISPQVWAWKEKRVQAIKRDVDLMLVLFSFEKDFYAKHGYDVAFVGHPLLDEVKVTSDKETFCRALRINPSAPLIGLLPGSRPKEVDRILPSMLLAAREIIKQKSDARFIIVRAPTIEYSFIGRIIEEHKLTDSCAILDHHYDAIASCDACMVASGTATLETAVLERPMVVVYKTSWLTYALAKIFIKIKNIGLVNIVAGKTIVPELIQNDANGPKLSAAILRFIDDKNYSDSVKNELQKAKANLGEPGAIARTAQKIVAFMNGK